MVCFVFIVVAIKKQTVGRTAYIFLVKNEIGSLEKITIQNLKERKKEKSESRGHINTYKFGMNRTHKWGFRLA